MERAPQTTHNTETVEEGAHTVALLTEKMQADHASGEVASVLERYVSAMSELGKHLSESVRSELGEISDPQAHRLAVVSHIEASRQKAAAAKAERNNIRENMRAVSQLMEGGESGITRVE